MPIRDVEFVSYPKVTIRGADEATLKSIVKIFREVTLRDAMVTYTGDASLNWRKDKISFSFTFKRIVPTEIPEDKVESYDKGVETKAALKEDIEKQLFFGEDK